MKPSPEGAYYGAAIRVVAEALFYRSAPVPSARLEFLERETKALLSAAGRRARTLFVLCLFGLIVLAPLWVRRLPPLGRLSLPLRILALARMEANPYTAPLVLAIKAALCVIYYEQPGVAHDHANEVTACLRPAPSLRQER
jgi:hypothetical protein